MPNTSFGRRGIIPVKTMPGIGINAIWFRSEGLPTTRAKTDMPYCHLASGKPIDHLINDPIKGKIAVVEQRVGAGFALQASVHVKPLVGELAEIVPTAELDRAGQPGHSMVIGIFR